MSFTISKMLQLPSFQDAVVLAGGRGTGAAVAGVTILESTDFSHAVMRGEIVLTSSFFLDIFTQNGINCIAECQKKQAVGICIKSSGDGSKLPTDLLATADRLRFPVILEQSAKKQSKDIKRT